MPIVALLAALILPAMNPPPPAAAVDAAAAFEAPQISAPPKLARPAEGVDAAAAFEAPQISAPPKLAHAAEGVDAAAAFERLKKLAGEWEGHGAMGKARLSYEVIANGTALVEKETGEGRKPMMTVFHLNGNRLYLTHYCMAGNQPRMEARVYRAETGELEFRFVDATNLAGPAAGHMRNARFRFVDQDTLETEWEFYENGRQKMAVSERYARIR